MGDGHSQLVELLQVGDFAFDRHSVGVGQRRDSPVLGPLLGRFVEGLVILFELSFQRLLRFLRFEPGLESTAQSVERARDGESGRGKQFAQDQGHERALALGQGLQIVPAEVVGDQVIEPVFALLRGKRLDDGQPLGEAHVGQHLAAQRPMTQRPQSSLECAEDCLIAEIGELLAEALDITECVLVYEAHQSE